MRWSFGCCVVAGLAALLMKSCGEAAPNSVWNAICEVTCERGVQCFPELPYGTCVSLCLSEFGDLPCDRNQTRLDECVAGIAALSCTALEEGDVPAECDEVCTGALCETVECDDQNDCTDDSCNAADGSCTNAPLADWTLCSRGTCLDGTCGTAFPCTEQGIRDAITVGGGPFTFACAGPTSVETSGTILIDRSVILDGEGNLTIDGMGTHLVLSVSRVEAQLANMTVTGGWSPSYEGAAGIENAGTLVLTSVSVTANMGTAAGAILNDGSLTLIGSTVSDNEALQGGGIYNDQEGILIVEDSELSKNRAMEHGGGIYNEGVATLTGSTISENSASQSSGGGVLNGPGGTLMVSNCMVIGNSAGFGGGGIGTHEAVEADDTTTTLIDTLVSGNSSIAEGGGLSNGYPGTLTLVNSTVSENTATWWGGGISSGGTLIVTESTVSGNSSQDAGGIGNQGTPSATLTLINSTVSGNTATNRGGGIVNLRSATLTNSTISGNDATIGDAISSQGAGSSEPAIITIRNTVIEGECNLLSSLVSSNGYNIESPGDTCGFDQPADQANVGADDLKLGPLQDNGGPTETHSLGAGSVAIDVIPADACEVDADQRGEPRPGAGGTMCDIGSVEVQP
jgi:hypothetical protein